MIGRTYPCRRWEPRNVSIIPGLPFGIHLFTIPHCCRFRTLEKDTERLQRHLGIFSLLCPSQGMAVSCSGTHRPGIYRLPALRT